MIIVTLSAVGFVVDCLTLITHPLLNPEVPAVPVVPAVPDEPVVPEEVESPEEPS